MSASAVARGDLRAYEDSVRLTETELVARLRDLLGAKLVVPGQDRQQISADYKANGIDLADSVYDYLVSDVINRDIYEEDVPGGSQ